MCDSGFVPVIRKKRRRQMRTLAHKNKDLKFHSIILANEEHEPYLLGELNVGATNNKLPTNFKECKIGFNNVMENDQFSIILKFEDNNIFITHCIDDLSFLKDFIQTKIFSFRIFTKKGAVYFKIYFISIPTPKFNLKIAQCIKDAFKLFYNIHIDSELLSSSKSKDYLSNKELKNLYKKVAEKREESTACNPHLLKNLSLLKSSLRPYQKKAVEWMIWKETKEENENETIHPSCEKITLKSNMVVYYNKYTGWIDIVPNKIKTNWRVGILADEMGLGKTVEVLALILSHRFKSNVNNGLKLVKQRIESDDDDDDEELQIVNKIVKRKRRLAKNKKHDKKIPEKKSKILESFEKGSSKKSGTYKALQSVYERTLSKYCTTASKPKLEVQQVQCVCGGIDDDNIHLDIVECIICHKKQHPDCLGWNPELGNFKCPQCWLEAEPMESKATLIVVPSSLQIQWCNEIMAHIKSGLTVLNYNGYMSAPVYPTELLNYDVVITSYKVLQAELKLTELRETANLRNQRKYWPQGTPLTRILWWRLCLDEAQLIEAPASIVAVMAKKIRARHRWGVTGTPLSKNIKDLYGLIDYLQIEPYNEPDTWTHLLYNPYLQGNKEPIYNFLSKVLWRTTKSSVLDQINIPKQTYVTHWIEMSAVEKFFYYREHDSCAADFLKLAHNFDWETQIRDIIMMKSQVLLGPILTLMCLCSDPTRIRGEPHGPRKSVTTKRNIYSMKDLLESLISKNRLDCEEKLRSIVSSLNGLAGIYLLMNEPDDAIQEYRNVLQLVSRFSTENKPDKDKIAVDKLLQIHAMHNLAEVLDQYGTSEHTLRDCNLRQDCANLENQYIDKFMKDAATGKESYLTFTNNIEQSQNKFIMENGQWYSDGIEWIETHNLHSDLRLRIEAAALNAHLECKLRLDNLRTLLRHVYLWDQDLTEKRNKLFEDIDDLYYEDIENKRICINEQLVSKAVDCHLSLKNKNKKRKKKKDKCPICIVNDQLKDYESLLFTMQHRSDPSDEMALIGSWKPRVEEIVFRTLSNLLKIKQANSDLVQDSKIHLGILETLKKEFKAIRKFWTLLDALVCAKDELNLCKMKFNINNDENDEKPNINRVLKNLMNNDNSELKINNLMRAEELPQQIEILRSNEMTAKTELDGFLGKRNYLETLRQQQFEGKDPDPCPICQGALVNIWAILSCAHTICMDCFDQLVETSPKIFNCCVCRSKQHKFEVAYIDKSSQNNEQIENGKIKVIGDFSSKIKRVIRVLLELMNDDPFVKVIIFSPISVLLDQMQCALDKNNIKTEYAGNYAFTQKIQRFKDPQLNITVLLLQVTSGSKGLNLIEASHVFFLDPLLDPASELQAIGRVHRIGQTKPTTVHRFIVRGTIDEAIHKTMNLEKPGLELSSTTIGQLRDLFK